MKLIKYLFILCTLVLGIQACDDDNEEQQLPGGNATTEKVAAAFRGTAKTVLRNGGQVRIPVTLEKPASGIVKINIAAEAAETDTDAEEGIDFRIEEKVINIPAGDTVGYITVNVLDGGEVMADKSVNINILSVYGAGKKAESNQTFALHITSNAFVEFEKPEWEMYESAASSESAAGIQDARFIPLLISGDLKAASTVVFEVTNGTAIEPTHFTMEKELAVEPGSTHAKLEIKPVDNEDINADRLFSVRIKEIRGEGNLIVGKGQDSCRVKIISEEIIKTAAFAESNLEIQEGNQAEITIRIDHAPEAAEKPVVVKIAPVEGEGNAILDTDYELSATQVTFNADETEKKITVRTIDENELFDRNFSLKITSISAGNQYEDEPLKVRIKNDEFPSFSSPAYNSLEGTGTNQIPVSIPKALDHDVTLKIKAVEETAIAGTNFNLPANEVVIKAGQTSANLQFDILVEKQFKPGKFQIAITSCDDIEYKNPIATGITIIENSGYRKWLGKCRWEYGSLKPLELEIIAGENDEEFKSNFGKFYFIKGISGWANWKAALSYNNTDGSVGLLLAGNWKFGTHNLGTSNTYEGGFIYQTPDIVGQNSYYTNGTLPLVQGENNSLTMPAGYRILMGWFLGTQFASISDAADVFKITKLP